MGVVVSARTEYLVMLSAAGNPDRGQFAPVAPSTSVRVPSLRAAQRACRAYIDRHDLGGGNWSGGEVHMVRGDMVKRVGRFTYNGRFWRGR